jgi:hypothetical protein
MKLEYVPPIEIGKQRHAWFKKHLKPEMTLDEVIQLNDKALCLFPSTVDERRLKTASLMAMPEFVL